MYKNNIIPFPKKEKKTEDCRFIAQWDIEVNLTVDKPAEFICFEHSTDHSPSDSDIQEKLDILLSIVKAHPEIEELYRQELVRRKYE